MRLRQQLRDHPRINRLPARNVPAGSVLIPGGLACALPGAGGGAGIEPLTCRGPERRGDPVAAPA
jgi:hypothetical protein